MNRLVPALALGLALMRPATGCAVLFSDDGGKPWPSPSDPCFELELSGLPAGPFTLKDSYPDTYTVTSPCGSISGCGCPMVQDAADIPGCAAGRPLGYLAQNSSALLRSATTGEVSGVALTLQGGLGGRTAIYNLLCDASVPASNPPEHEVTFGSKGQDRMTYVVTWRNPACCPQRAPGGASCYTPPQLPLPTKNQLRYQQSEIVALTHFNMASFVRNGDPGCAAENWNTKKPYAAGPSSDPSTFNPAKLNTSQWAEVYQRVGVKGAVLTAKHGCGHLLWPTKVTLPDGSPYDYAVGNEKSAIKKDVLRMFTDSMMAVNITHGFYYSLTDNFYLNIAGHKAHAAPPLPGQVDVNQTEFERIALGQVAEIWTNYGQLGEIWFDGGYGGDMQAGISKLIKQQKLAVGFGGSGVMGSPVGWVGTESGMPGYPHIWSHGGGHGGSPSSGGSFMPKCCDTTLQSGDVWFFEPGWPVRTLAIMIKVYHQTVGRNGVLELDFGINRDGLVDPHHVERYNEFGDWIRACYGGANQVGEASGALTGGSLTIQLPSPTTVDRTVLREDLSQGERVRGYSIEALVAGAWVPFATGTGVGNRQIDLAAAPVLASAMRLNVSAAAAEPIVTQFAVFKPCPSK